MRLAAIYRANPALFVRQAGGREVEEIRCIGQALHEQGGMALMLRAHQAFGTFCSNVPGAPRNLEMIWDGIGDWMG